MVQLPFVQNWIGSEVSRAVAAKLDTKVSVGKVRLGLLNRVIIDDFKLYDKKLKPMIEVSRLAARIDYARLVKTGRVYISSAQMFGLKGVFYKERNAAKPNYQFVLDSLASKDKNKKSDFELSINSLIVRHGAVKYDRYDIAQTPKRFNTSHIDVNNISAHVIIPYYTSDSLSVTVKKLSLTEASGLDLRKLSFNLVYDKKGAELSDFELSLPHTDINISRLHAGFDNSGGRNAKLKLGFEGVIDDSKITLSDAACFAGAFRRADKPLYVNASYSGTDDLINVDRLQIRSADGGIRLQAGGFITKAGDGIRWNVNVARLLCTAEGIADVAADFTDEGSGISKIAQRLGDIQYTGTVSGTGNSQSVNGTLNSALGQIYIKGGHTRAHIDAYVKTDGFNLGGLLDNDKLGMLATTVNLRGDIGRKGISNMRVDGMFPRFDYNGYSYKNIAAEGVYDNSKFSGCLCVDDPNGHISISGNMDMNRSGQSTDIEATIRDLDLAALKITDKWKGARFDLDVSVDTYVSETEANMFRGRVGVRNFSMFSDEKVYNLDSLYLTAETGRLTLQSDFARAELSGDYMLRSVITSFTNMLHSTLPALCPSHGTADNRFRLSAEVYKSDWLNTLFGVPLTLKSPLTINAAFDDATRQMQLACSSDGLNYDGSPYENISVTAGASGDTLSVEGNVRKVMNNGHRLDLSLLADAIDGRLATSVKWNNNMDRLMAGELNAETKFVKTDNGKSEVEIAVRPSDILFNDTVWNVLPSRILYKGGDLVIDHFAIEHNKQHIRIDGMATRHPEDSITVDLQDVDINYVLDLVNFHSVEFGGNMTGKAFVKSVFYEPDLYANLEVERFTFQRGRLGKLFAAVKWNKEAKQIDIDAHADDADNARTVIAGYVSPANNRIDLDIKAEDTNIEFLESFCGDFMDNVEATANGGLRLHGPLGAINLTGEIVADGSMRITPINVSYTLVNDTIHFLPDNIVFRADTIRDRNGNIGIVNGALHHRNLSHLTYDMRINTRNLLCYDTNSYGEESFYGTAYGTGVCDIRGRDGMIDIDIDITPEKNSFIEYNAASPDVIADQQFITWHDKTAVLFDGDVNSDSTDTLKHVVRESLPVDIPSDMRINFIVNMTPEATLRVLMDKNTNDYIALNGTGTIRASYFNKGSFDMFGTYLIDHGVYTLTIQNIIKKVFQFQRGGTIVFGGDPYDASFDLQAVYTVNGVPLSDLQLGNSFSSNNVRVDCIMNISGTPQSPHVDFDIDMPTVNEDAEQMVRTVINSEEEMNQQVVYLLSVGRFYIQGNNNSSEQNRSNQTSLAMQSLLSGTISQQINTLLGSLVKNNNWTFGANISTGDEGFNNAEYEGLLSGRLLNNRLIINGQFGYRDNANATTSFIGDFDINYLLLPNGNISLKVYNQTNDRYFTKSSLNTQGIGLILKKDFNSLMELFGFKRKRQPLILIKDDEDNE